MSSLAIGHVYNLFLLLGLIAFLYLLPVVRNDPEYYDIASVLCMTIALVFIVSISPIIGVLTFLLGSMTLVMRAVTYRWPLLLMPQKW